MTNSLLSRVTARLRRQLWLDPAGYGRPVRREDLDREYVTGNWDHFYSEEELARNMVVLGLVVTRYPAPRVLDLGCGSGRLGQLIQAYRPSRYLGVDLSSEGIAQARAAGLDGANLVVEDFETWRPGEEFDCIVFNECIGYAHDPLATVQAFAPFVAPGGRIVISHFRFGNSARVWQRIGGQFPFAQEFVVENRRRQRWDIKTIDDPKGTSLASP